MSRRHGAALKICSTCIDYFFKIRNDSVETSSLQACSWYMLGALFAPPGMARRGSSLSGSTASVLYADLMITIRICIRSLHATVR